MLRQHDDQGFAAFTLSDQRCQVTVIPALGGRISSFIHRSRQREWLFAPDATRKLFTNQPDEWFMKSTHIGVDECLPSVNPCVIDGYQHADHGEAWARAWTVDSATDHDITLSIVLPYRALRLQRRVSLGVHGLRCDYALSNPTTENVRFLWAFHALFAWSPGDRIELPPSITQATATSDGIRSPLFAGGGTIGWPIPAPGVDLSRNELGGPDTHAKMMIDARSVDQARIAGADGASLRIGWSASALRGLGLWLTRGSYLGQHGIAIEPSTHVADILTDPRADERQLAAGETRRWWVELNPG